MGNLCVVQNGGFARLQHVIKTVKSSKQYRDFFRGKKITVMGLGLLGRGVGVAQFLAECGADLLVTDLKSKKELTPSLAKLKKYKNIRYVLGEHRLEDFDNRDMVIKAAGVRLDSPFIAEARKHDTPVEMDASLFAKLSPATIIGVTGTRGKSTVTQLLYDILKKAGKRAHLGGNVRGVATLPLLKKAKEGDIVLMELDSWQLQGFGDSKLSPHIAVFTNFMPDHLNYYDGDTSTSLSAGMEKYFADKSNIFAFQKKGDFLIIGQSVLRYIARVRPKPKSKIIVSSARLPKGFTTTLIGTHNIENISLAVTTARAIGIATPVIKKAVASFKGVSGRLELVRKVRGISIYNDTTATSPDATIAALRALHKKGDIILIAGGTDKKLPVDELVDEIGKHAKTVVLLPGTGTDRIKRRIGKTMIYHSLYEAVLRAFTVARKGDITLFSPAFTSFGLFKNEYDRGEQFNAIVNRL